MAQLSQRYFAEARPGIAMQSQVDSWQYLPGRCLGYGVSTLAITAGKQSRQAQNGWPGGSPPLRSSKEKVM